MFPFYFSTKSKKQNGHSSEASRSPFAKFPLQASIMPYFPLPLSILAGTNLIMLLIFLFNPCLLPKKIHSPFDFQENSSSFDFREKSIKTPKENKKKCFYFFCSLCFLDLFKGFICFYAIGFKFYKP